MIKIECYFSASEYLLVVKAVANMDGIMLAAKIDLLQKLSSITRNER